MSPALSRMSKPPGVASSFDFWARTVDTDTTTGVPFVTHVEPGKPGEVVAAVVKRIRCDALFAGAHMSHRDGRPSAVVVSHAEEILRHTDIPVVIQP